MQVFYGFHMFSDQNYNFIKFMRKKISETVTCNLVASKLSLIMDELDTKKHKRSIQQKGKLTGEQILMKKLAVKNEREISPSFRITGSANNPFRATSQKQNHLSLQKVNINKVLVTKNRLKSSYQIQRTSNPTLDQPFIGSKCAPSQVQTQSEKVKISKFLDLQVKTEQFSQHQLPCGILNRKFDKILSKSNSKRRKSDEGIISLKVEGIHYKNTEKVNTSQKMRGSKKTKSDLFQQNLLEFIMQQYQPLTNRAIPKMKSEPNFAPRDYKKVLQKIEIEQYKPQTIICSQSNRQEPKNKKLHKYRSLNSKRKTQGSVQTTRLSKVNVMHIIEGNINQDNRISHHIYSQFLRKDERYESLNNNHISCKDEYTPIKECQSRLKQVQKQQKKLKFIHLKKSQNQKQKKYTSTRINSQQTKRSPKFDIYNVKKPVLMRSSPTEQAINEDFHVNGWENYG